MIKTSLFPLFNIVNTIIYLVYHSNNYTTKIDDKIDNLQVAHQIKYAQLLKQIERAQITLNFIYQHFRDHLQQTKAIKKAQLKSYFQHSA